MKNRTLKAGAGVLLALTMMLSACGGGEEAAEVVDGPWEDVVAAANDEGQMNLYSIAPPIQNDRLIAAFNEEYPDIKVTVTRGVADLQSRVETEIRTESDGADVFFYSDANWFKTNEQYVLDVDGPNAEAWKDEFWAQEGKAPLGTTYPWTMFVWNTDIFPDGFRTWDDLLDPSVKGQIGSNGDVTTTIAGTLDSMEAAIGPDFLTRLGDQNLKFYPSAVPMAQAVASGELGVAFISTPSIAQDLKNQGAPLEFGYPDPGWAIGLGIGAISTSKRPNAARVFLDFVMSEEGQEALNGEGFGAAGRDNVSGTLDLDELGYSIIDFSSYTPEKREMSEEKFNSYFR